MERLFWGHVTLYEDTYINMLRLQGANKKFDPAVSRYLETLRITENAQKTEGSGTRASKRSGGTSSETEQVDPDIVEHDGTRDENAYKDSETLTMQDRARESVRSGSRQLVTTGEAADNYSEDAPGSYEESTHKIDTQSSTQRSGKLITTDQGQSATRNTQANKAAPMTAVNLQRQAGRSGPNGASDSYANVANGALGAQDWTSATAYAESGQDQGDSRRREEYYEGDNAVVSTSGQAQDNTDRTEFSRKQQQATHMTDTETFDALTDKTTETGGEKRDRDMGARHGTDHDVTKTTRGAIRISNTDEGNNKEENSSKQDQSGRSIDWYRHTGREGLTPQQALAEGLKYLADYPDAILWFCSKLEPCFIGVIDIDLED